MAGDAERARLRRRWWLIGGSVLAASAIGTVVALAIVTSGGDSEGSSSSLPDPQELPPDTSQPQPTFAETTLPPLPEPREFISDADKDLAPFTADSFFTGATMEIDGRAYDEVATAGHRDCASAVTPALGDVLTRHDCVSLLRATYSDGSVAVTVGVAQFPSQAEADAAHKETELNLLPLTSGDAPDFCGSGGCSTTANQVGRYTYFTIAGNADGTPASGEGSPARQAAHDGNDHAFELIIQRGEAQASASASARVEERRNQD
ncbi:hypothetical protein ACTWP5_20105 [Streptomyces sp. 4N509B]|uniref:hypothetical protein n=1 Tax=Streptomyces sp. 4N509B TaxID=3457413 RepID=UPI003FD429EA